MIKKLTLNKVDSLEVCACAYACVCVCGGDLTIHRSAFYTGSLKGRKPFYVPGIQHRVWSSLDIWKMHAWMDR